MANKAQLNKLAEGVDAWNEWRELNPDVNIDLSEVDLSWELFFRKYKNAVRTLAPLASVIVSLLLSNLFFNPFKNLLDFIPNFTVVITINITLRLLLYGIILSFIKNTLLHFFISNFGSLNLKQINFSNVNLTKTDLRGINLIYADLSFANLSYSDLSYVLVIGTNFSHAVLTGAILEGWQINSDTYFEGIECNYVYLDSKQQERCPEYGEFTSNEFNERFQLAKNIIELTFKNGVPWKALSYAFNNLNVQILDNYGSKLSLREYKVLDNGLITLKISYPPNADGKKLKAALELKVQEVAYLRGQNDFLKGQNESLLERMFTSGKVSLYDSVIQIGENNRMNNENVSEKFVNNFQGSDIANFANVIKDNARQQANQHIYISERKKTLAETVAEIQRLLKQLEETNPNATEQEQFTYVNVATRPDLRQRAIAALKEGSDTFVDEFILDNKYLKVVKAVIKGWLQSSD